MAKFNSDQLGYERPSTFFERDPGGQPSDVAVNRDAASKLRDHLKFHGHKAKVERSAKGDEHRVWVQHPIDKDTVAYAHTEDFSHDGKFTPYWIRK